MPKNRKYFPHGSTLFVTSRTEEGLPMPANHVMNHIIWGVLAEARSKYDVKICHFMFMANHLHMLLVVEDPAHVSEFMKYIKAEIAHSVNRLLGRFKKTIWSEGYDSPVVLTVNRVLHYINYIYLNPVRAGLVETVDEYPGVSSWKMFREGRAKSTHARVPRSRISKLASPALSIAEQKELVNGWRLQKFEAKEFVLEPWAWLECFSGSSRERYEREIVAGIEHGEEVYREQRRKAGKEVVGITTLRRQSLNKEHIPEKRSRRMIVLCEEKQMRLAFIERFRALVFMAREVYKKWCLGELSLKIPPGMLAPRFPLLVSAVFF